MKPSQMKKKLRGFSRFKSKLIVNNIYFFTEEEKSLPINKQHIISLSFRKNLERR